MTIFERLAGKFFRYLRYFLPGPAADTLVLNLFKEFLPDE